MQPRVSRRRAAGGVCATRAARAWSYLVGDRHGFQAEFRPTARLQIGGLPWRGACCLEHCLQTCQLASPKSLARTELAVKFKCGRCPCSCGERLQAALIRGPSQPRVYWKHRLCTCMHFKVMFIVGSSCHLAWYASPSAVHVRPSMARGILPEATRSELSLGRGRSGSFPPCANAQRALPMTTTSWACGVGEPELA